MVIAVIGGVGVNGAAAGWPRKGKNADLHGGGIELRQWGRGRMAAEGVATATAAARRV